MSLDLVMGLVGGLAGIMWATLDLIIGNYESFRYENSLIGSIYPTSPVILDTNETSDANSESYAKRQMMLTVAERGKYHYRYAEYLCTRLYRKLCCCCKTEAGRCESRIKRLQRHEQASEKLAEELDVVKFLYVHRIGQFIAKLMLNKHQRALVTSFKKYQIDDLGDKQVSSRLDTLLSLAKTSPSNYARLQTQKSLLEPTIQDDGTVDDYAAFQNIANLTQD